MWDLLPLDDLYAVTERLIQKKAGVGAGRPVAAASWLRTLEQIRALPEITP